MLGIIHPLLRAFNNLRGSDSVIVGKETRLAIVVALDDVCRNTRLRYFAVEKVSE